MRRFASILIFILLFIAAVYGAFLFDDEYRKALRHLYIALSKGKISFAIQKKYLHFASDELVLSFGLFFATVCFLLYKQQFRRRIIIICLSIALFVISILIHCYFDVLLKLAECTTCTDGKRILRYNDINYDFIFITALLLAILPSILVSISRRKK